MIKENMSKIKRFESKQIRMIWSEADQKWYFTHIDFVETFADNFDPKKYIKKTSQRERRHIDA